MDMLELYEMDMLRRARGQAGLGYRTADLVLHLDGIQNTRAGTHNPFATVWEDLAGNMDVTLYHMAWGTDCALFLGNTASYGLGDYLTFAKGTTIEVVYRQIGNYGAFGSSVMGWGWVNGGGLRPILISTTNYIRIVLVSSIVNIGAGIPLNQATYAGYSQGVLIQNGTFISHALASGTGTTTTRLLLGGQWENSNANTLSATFSLPGCIYAVRVYDANLTAEELYAHWLIDKARFNIPEA